MTVARWRTANQGAAPHRRLKQSFLRVVKVLNGEGSFHEEPNEEVAVRADRFYACLLLPLLVSLLQSNAYRTSGGCFDPRNDDGMDGRRWVKFGRS